MTADSARPLSLSGAARGRVNWQRINDVTAGQRPRSTAEGEARQADPERVREIFKVAKAEFQVALISLRNLIRVTTWLVVLFGAVAIIGLLLILMFNLKVPGAVTSGVSLGTLIGLVFKMWQLGRDQAMLELIPSRYEIGLSLATSPAQFSKILDQFLAETESLRHPAS